MALACLMCGCRESEVLSVFAAIIRRLKQGMESEVPKVLAAVFEPTLQVCVCEWCSTNHVCLTLFVADAVCSLSLVGADA